MNDEQLEGQMSIFDFLNEAKKEPAQVEEAKKEPICSYSEHVCNKNELFKVAESLDNPFCPHVCCRLCSDFECGARCNGASEPVKKTSLQFEEYKEHCRHNGWTRGATETEPAAVMCSFNNRQNAKCWGDWIECNMDNCPLLKGVENE